MAHEKENYEEKNVKYFPPVEHPYSLNPHFMPLFI